MKQTIAIVFGCLITVSAYGKPVQITVQDKQNNPLENAVVYLDSEKINANYNGEQVAIMDQVNRQFSPYILPIQQGQSVSFPNSDSIKHHVYSFSPAKVFELQLYKGRTAEKVTFTDTGIVELGCNVHDWMLGYIFVAPSPYFAKTNEQGIATIDAPEGKYQLKTWHPRLSEKDIFSHQELSIPANSTATITMTQDLASDTSYYDEEQDEFSDYE